MSDSEKDLVLAKQVESIEKRLAKLEDRSQSDSEKVHGLEKAIVKTDVLLENLTKAIQDLVTRGEFTPVKMIVFGLAATILSSSVAAIFCSRSLRFSADC